MKHLRYLIFLAVILFSNSCNKSNTVFKQTGKIPDAIWLYSQPVTFTADLEDTTSNYNIFIVITHNAQYPYANLWTAVKTVAPDGKSYTDTINMFLADKDYNWIGKTKGKTTVVKYLYKDTVGIKQSGEYKFSIKHIMRKDKLEGVEKIGLIITKVK